MSTNSVDAYYGARLDTWAMALDAPPMGPEFGPCVGCHYLRAALKENPFDRSETMVEDAEEG